MNSLTANKINLCLVSIKFFIICTILCATIYNLMYQTIICLFVILLTQLFPIMHTTEIFKPRLFSSQATRLHTWLTVFLLFAICFVFLFYRSTQTVWLTFFLENSIAASLVFVFCCIACCCVHLFVYLFFSYWYYWFTYNKLLVQLLLIVFGPVFENEFKLKIKLISS